MEHGISITIDHQQLAIPGVAPALSDLMLALGNRVTASIGANPVEKEIIDITTEEKSVKLVEDEGREEADPPQEDGNDRDEELLQFPESSREFLARVRELGQMDIDQAREEFGNPNPRRLAGILGTMARAAEKASIELPIEIKRKGTVTVGYQWKG